MTKNLAEILLFASLMVNAALLTFIAGILRKVMSDMDAAAFKQFVVSLVRHSKKSPFMLIALNIPFVGAIPYLYFYGFGNRWLVAGLVLWLIAGSIAKAIKLPIYKAIGELDVSDAEKLKDAQRRMNGGNTFQAVLNSVAAVLACVPFVR